jgi:flavorubredoxin
MIIEIIRNKFGMDATEPPLLVKYAPDQTSLEKCRELGRKVAERLIHAV